MSARFPTNIHLSVDELARHGGATGPHRDGWGIAFVHDHDALVVREPAAASESRWLMSLQEQRMRSGMVLAHVRKATQGERRLSNTQPFVRELGGRMHVFAHNGMVPGIEREPTFPARRFRPVGDTDSEHAFCALLERLAPLWESGLPSSEDRIQVIADFARDLRSLGPANFLYSDTNAIFAHSDKRKDAAGQVRAPGLHVLCRQCSPTEDGVAIAGVTLPHEAEQEVALVASVPLSAEPWEPLAEGEIVVLREGRVVSKRRR
jgi:glutamine amidotransferase